METKRYDIYHHSSNEKSAEVIKPCRWCGTKGYIDNTITGKLSRRDCEVCGGVGKVKFSKTVVRCGRCGNTGSIGKKMFSAPKKCPICKGAGWVEPKEL